MRGWLALGLCIGLSGCGLAIPALLELAPLPEGFVARQSSRELPIELRFIGDPRGWRQTESGGISLHAGTALALRVPGLTLVRALLHVRASGGYRMLLRTTPREWVDRQRAPVSLWVLPEKLVLQTATRSDTLAFPGEGSYRWELLQLEHGYWLRLECLPQLWIPASEPITEWLILEPLPGAHLTLEGVVLEEALPFVGVQQQVP